MGKLTTHVLDTVRGCPGVGIGISLVALNDSRRSIVEMVTNEDGRTAQPLLEGDTYRSGQYEIVFSVGAYFRQLGLAGDNGFLDQIPVRFRIDADNKHYHVPLLVSPWSYTTYRGS